MRDWEKLFEILQALNPESDKFLIKHESALYDIKDNGEYIIACDNCNEDESTKRWEDICYYMDLLKPEEEK